MQYNIGDKVVITGNTDCVHVFPIGTECEIISGPDYSEKPDIFYELTGLVSLLGTSQMRLEQSVWDQDFTPASNSMQAKADLGIDGEAGYFVTTETNF